MLFAGSDVSGDENDGQIKYIAFIVGKEEDINSQHNDIDINEIHMVRLEPQEKKQVIERIDFESYNLKAWCFYVDRQQIVDSIFNHIRLHPKNKRKPTIHKSFDSHFLYQFKDDLEEFTYKHGTALNDLQVQCDGDMSLTIKNWRMKKAPRGKAHQLADAIAWCNERDQKLNGCQEVALQEIIRNRMQQDLLK
jgi:hypothetical protein